MVLTSWRWMLLKEGMFLQSPCIALTSPTSRVETWWYLLVFRSQTTKGIWIAKCAGIEPCTLVLDLEGTDGQERGDVFFFFVSICYILTYFDNTVTVIQSLLPISTTTCITFYILEIHIYMPMCIYTLWNTRRLS